MCLKVISSTRASSTRPARRFTTRPATCTARTLPRKAARFSCSGRIAPSRRTPTSPISHWRRRHKSSSAALPPEERYSGDVGDGRHPSPAASTVLELGIKALRLVVLLVQPEYLPVYLA